ncbi:SGT1 protein-domain-containing protein [Dissophora ornata]|nr:hypothetical protein BGZ58_000388 [Dissophora ornata]KAI8596462.1 SGT1 protein-domain-containing protein [Dissophora ornata]
MDSTFLPHDQLQEQRRALAEETVSYAIYFPPITDGPGSDQNQNQSNVTLESVHLAKTQISSIVAELVKDYIWHKDAFSLRIESGKGKLHSSQPYLKGETRVGDSLDDEWLIVFLLREITKRVPGSVARVQDNDGEFLLIEAADHIPSWLDPDNSENRVFIYERNLHIIPIATTAEEKKTLPPTLGTKAKSSKLQDALDLIRASSSLLPSVTTTISTLASRNIQQAAFGPLLPDSTELDFAARKTTDQRHYARCQIPVDVARILKARPELITRACEAFYTRDTLAMAACSRMTKFFPVAAAGATTTSLPGVTIMRKNATPFVTTAVCFTKTCYAQLLGQRFQPPKIWDGIVPPPRAEDASDPQKVKEAELGMKLTCGFEILCSPNYPGDYGFKSGEEIKLEDFPFATNVEWRTFKNNLSTRKFFGDERPGSQGYQRLEEVAKRQFLEHKSEKLQDLGGTDNTLGSVSYHGHGYHPIQEIERILSSEPRPNDLSELVDDRKDDDDSWMDVDLQMLEDMMQARGFGGSAARKTSQPSKAGLDMQQMLDRFGEFIQEGEGGIEGAEFMDEQSDEDEDDDDDDGEDDTDSQEENDVNMDKEDASKQDSEEQEEDDDDIFASDYEERQAKKQSARRRDKSGSGGAFMFGSELMSFDNGVVGESPNIENKKNTQAFALDREQFKSVLTQTFGEDFLSARAKARLDQSKNEGEGERSDEDDEMDDEGLQEYMKVLDAELAGTKVGQSFEKMSVGSSISTTSASTTTSPSKEDKGKGVLRSLKPVKAEKNLEELMKEYAERSRRGFNRHGPLPGNAYGYDPTAMALADDEDEDDEDDILSSIGARVTALSPGDEVGDELMEDEETEEVVDVDLNLAKNLLESFKSQGGLPGPGGNLLSRLGIVLPRDEGDSEDEDED